MRVTLTNAHAVEALQADEKRTATVMPKTVFAPEDVLRFRDKSELVLLATYGSSPRFTGVTVRASGVLLATLLKLKSVSHIDFIDDGIEFA
jgi:hypothetical protein